jgi:limonene-1,2-epoxide hydrolase
LATGLESRGEATASEAAAFVEGFAAAWGSSDVDMLLALLDDDVVLEGPGLPDVHGKDEAREMFTKLFRAFPGLHAIVHRWAANGNTVFIEFTLAGEFGGRTLSWPAVDRFTLRDGLAAERVNYFDGRRFMLEILKRPRGWPQLVRSGLRPSFK